MAPPAPRSRLIAGRLVFLPSGRSYVAKVGALGFALVYDAARPDRVVATVPGACSPGRELTGAEASALVAHWPGGDW